MRIHGIVVSGFRAFSERVALSLEADTILLSGGNGRGKTSLLDAIVWALLGCLPRLRDKQAEVVSKYGDGTAHVELALRDSEGRTFVIRRSHDGERLRTTLEDSGTILTDDAADSRLRRLLWPRPTTSDPASAIQRIVTRSVYLQQDQIAHFVAADTDSERFDVISDLVGTTEVTQLEEALARARRAWSSRTKELAAQCDEASQAVARLEALAARLTPDRTPSIDTAEWNRWWRTLADLLGTGEPVPSIDSGAAAALDRAMAVLTAHDIANRRRVRALDNLLDALERQPPQPEESELKAARQRAHSLAEELSAARAALLRAQARAAEERRQQVAAREAREELAALAAIAHRHLGDSCPVCGQAIDAHETSRRLEALIAQAKEPAPISGAAVDPAAELVERLEKDQAEVANLVAQLEHSARAWDDWRVYTIRLAEEAGLEYSPRDTLVARATNQAKESKILMGKLSSLREAGERMAVVLAESSQALRLRSTQVELDSARSRQEELASELRAREVTGQLASSLIDALRAASSTLVRYRLAQLQPIAQAIYSRIDPHLSLRVVELNSRYSYGKGRIDTAISDPSTTVRSAAPEAVLSNSQLNAYALSLFLAMNLGASLPIEAVILDDPLQSMDDVNLLGVADLLRRLRSHRQILISTHERRLASLLERKLRPTDAHQRTMVVDFGDWTRRGPSITVRFVPPDEQPLQIVA